MKLLITKFSVLTAGLNSSGDEKFRKTAREDKTQETWA
jgi:hypothetical protein